FRQFVSIDTLLIAHSREFRLDYRSCVAGIEPMHGQISVVNGYAGLGKKSRRRRFPHAYGAGETNHHHVVASRPFLPTLPRPHSSRKPREAREQGQGRVARGCYAARLPFRLRNPKSLSSGSPRIVK